MTSQLFFVVTFLCSSLHPLAYGTALESQKSLLPLKRQTARALLKRIDRAQLPNRAVITPASQREFVLHAPEVQDLGIVAIYFNYTPTGADKGPPEQCGVFIVEPDGKNTFISTIGPAFQHGTGLCGGVQSVAIASDGGDHPRLISIFKSTRMHGEEVPQPFILSWDIKVKMYVLDDAATEWLWDQSHADTVPQIRRLLAKHR